MYPKAQCWLPCYSTSTRINSCLCSPKYNTQTISPSYSLTNAGGRSKLPYCEHGNRVPLPQELAPKAQHREYHVLLMKLDQTQIFGQNLEKMSAKISRVSLIRRLAVTIWGAATKTLRISTQFLVSNAAEYSAPVWCRITHTKKLDAVLNNSLRIVSGSLRDTPVNHLPILSGIARLYYAKKQQSWHSLARLNVTLTTFSSRQSASFPDVHD